MISSRRVVVVGGGITGLVAAYRLTRTSNGDAVPDVILMEASGRVGGKLRTIDLDGLPVEAGADSFVVRKPWAVDLCRELGLGDELVRPAQEGAHVWTGRGLIPFPDRAAFGVPSTVSSLLRWPGLSWGGRIRAIADLWKKASTGDADQSLGSLIRRRLGPEALRALVGPLLAGIHAGDPERLSLLATFPELRTWERGHDSLIRGARAAAKAVRVHREEDGGEPLFASLAGGLSDLVTALESHVGPERVWLGTPVVAVEARGNGYAVRTAGSNQPLDADAVILAQPAFDGARLLRAVSPEAARHLAAIPYVSTAVVFLVYRGGRLPPGTGFVTPLGRRMMTACTWVSSKWPRGDLRDRVILRCFVGRAGDERALRLPDPDLSAAVAAEADEALGLDGPPSLAHVVRWPRSMPQYDVGHVERVSAIELALEEAPGLFAAGSALRGIGIADCVRQANETAERVKGYLRGLAERPGAGTATIGRQ